MLFVFGCQYTTWAYRKYLQFVGFMLAPDSGTGDVKSFVCAKLIHCTAGVYGVDNP